MANGELTTEVPPVGGMAPGADIVPSPTTEEELPPTTLSLTAEQIPALSGKAIGDRITMEVSGISEDGSNYELSIIEEAMEEPAVAETPPAAGAAGGGREAMSEALI